MGERFAIVIGISDYSQVGEVANLRFASADAKRLASILVNNGQIPPQHLYMLADGIGKDQSAFARRDPPTRANILATCKYVFERARNGDVVLLYFAGHGLEIESTPYLLTSDTKMDLVRETALDVNSLESQLTVSKAQFNLKIFDACRSGYSDGRVAESKMTRQFEQSLLKTGTGWAAISACSSGELAHEDPDFQQGVFTYYLCEALTQPPSSGSGAVTLESAVDRVKTSMATWCDLKMKRQTPQFRTEISGILELSNVTASASSTVIQTETRDPVRDFYHRLDQHLDATPTAVREFSLTNTSEFDQMTDKLFSISKEDWGNFEHPAMSVEIIDPKPLQHIQNAQNAFGAKLGQLKLTNELTGNRTGMTIILKGTEIAVPGAELVIAAVQFKYFYWIWRTLTFQSAITPDWQPKERSNSSFYALRPRQANDTDVLKRISTEFMAYTLTTCEDWAKQLAAYLKGRLKPFQDAGNIFT